MGRLLVLAWTNRGERTVYRSGHRIAFSTINVLWVFTSRRLAATMSTLLRDKIDRDLNT